MVLAKFFENKFIYHTLIVLAGSTLANFGNYIFHLSMGRLMVPAEYGALTALISFFTLLIIPTIAFNLIIVKAVTAESAKGNPGNLGGLFNYFLIRFLVLGLVVFFFLLIFSRQISQFLKIGDSTPVVIISGLVLTVLLVVVNRAFLQGLLKFEFFTLSGILEVVFKIGIAIILVKAGLSVLGAILAILLADLAIWAITFIPLKKWLPAKKTASVSLDNLKVNVLPLLIGPLALLSFYSSDVILVKHFFSEFEAGIYSSLSVIGRVIFFSSAAIGFVMFPVVSQRFSQRKGYGQIFSLSLVLVGLISGVILLFYSLWPKFTVSLLFGPAYSQVANFLASFGVFMFLFSLASVFVTFYLAIERWITVWFVILAAILQIILISFFHQTIEQVITVSIISSAILLFWLVVYFLKTQLATRSNRILQ